ncbi:hypothetical protein K2173_017138 [Erythroxylum novogranatense]|uniref:Uncharacterized protein n=1 Tax=Erythroxylum novogranatense TaxID=1862640 RepID=A0AAV8U5U4_9ROSI|nr:hypothetical protein K2173_017138 [Erythroxylum novogranatense]
MKRQRNLDSVIGPTKAEAGKTTTTTKKAIPKRKIKRVVEKAEERKSYCGESTSPVEELVLDNWEELKWLASDIVDEQMSWGSTWLPMWGVEYVGEAYGEMFGDVAWDEDIWNLKSINQIPNE